MADVTKMLEKDHREVARLFREIKKTNGAARRKLVDQLTADLRLHMKVEESIVYPAMDRKFGLGSVLIDEAKTEHKGARKVLADVEKLSPSQPGFDGALAMLEAGIKHHVREEEDEVFPKFRKSADADELNELGAKVAAAKERAGA